MTAKDKRTSREERARLVESHAGLVKHIASRMAVLLPQHVELDDLIHDGVLGLMEALERFDGSRGVRFETFAATRIRGRILDALRSQDWISRGARRRAREVEKQEEVLSHALGRSPSRQELCQTTGWSTAEIERRRRESFEGLVLSLDELRSLSETAEESVGESVADPDVDVLQEVELANRRQILMGALGALSERERLVLSLYYFEDLNIREIAGVLGVSEPRVSQLHTRSLRKLRDALKGERLELVG